MTAFVLQDHVYHMHWFTLLNCRVGFYLFRPLEAYPAHRGSFCIADEGESVLPPVLGEVLRRGAGPGCVRSRLSVLCGRGTPVPEPVGS